MKVRSTNSTCPFGRKYQRYWDVLSDRERQMKFDEYGLFALTPRRFSKPIVERIHGNRIVDACCSVGGMSIALADAGKQVTAIELDPHRLSLARENARLFGVADRIEFIEGDVLEVIPTLLADTVFFDGQWTGDAEHSKTRFSLTDFAPDGGLLLKASFGVTESVVLRTPSHFDFSELDRFQRPFDREETVVDQQVVAYTVYFGPTKEDEPITG